MKKKKKEQKGGDGHVLEVWGRHFMDFVHIIEGEMWGS